MSVSEPGKIITPWAESGLKNPIPPAANPATGRAGFDQGFSAINMTAKEAGGIPPFGQDFNGIFYEVTNILRYMQAGGQPTFDAALATAIGGYPKGAMVLGSDGLTLWQSKVDSNTDDPNIDPIKWGAFDVGLREDLSSPSGPNIIGFDGAFNYQAGSLGRAVSDSYDASNALAVTQDLVYRKSVNKVLPFKFPDYDDAFAFVGSPSYIYPQGHAYDNNGNVYIKYARGTYAVIVWYTSSGVYGGYFYIQPGGESLVVIDSGSSKTMFNKGGVGSLYSYNISSIPASGTVVPYTDTGVTGVGLQYAYDDGRWIIEQLPADVGVTGSRTKWNIYNAQLEKSGEFFVDKTVVGWQLPTEPLYDYVPKSQGVALRGGQVVFGLGGSYIPETDGPQSKPVAAIGIAELSLDGSVIAYGALNAAKFIARLQLDGYQIVRSESEGLSLRADGTLSHIVVTANPTTPGNTEFGIMLITEQDPKAESYSEMNESYAPFNSEATYSGIFPRGVDGLMHNPLTNEVMSTMDQLIQYMISMQSPHLRWYTSAVTVTPLPGISLPPSGYAEISNANNQTFLVSVNGVNGTNSKYSVNYNPSLSSYSVTKLGIEPSFINVGTGGDGDDSIGRVLYPHKDTDEEAVQAISVSSTSANNSVIIGGGSSVFNAATIIDFYTTPDRVALTGQHRLRIDGSGVVRPGADNVQSLGSESRRWSVVYAGTGTINISDAREKTEPVVIADALLDAADDISIDVWKWLDAIAKKGADSARWHFGPIAQQVRDAFAKHGLDGCDYGLLCYDKWDDQFEDEVATRENEEVRTRLKADGSTEEYLIKVQEEYFTGNRLLVLPAGDRWGIRPDQCLWLLAAASRRRAQRAEDRLEVIEAKLAAAGW